MDVSNDRLTNFEIPNQTMENLLSIDVSADSNLSALFVKHICSTVNTLMFKNTVLSSRYEENSKVADKIKEEFPNAHIMN
jgi:hypothetical protein